MDKNSDSYKKYISDILHTYAPLYRFLKVFSLNCHVQQYKSPGFEIFKRIVVASLYGSLNLCALIYKLKYLYNMDYISVKYTDIVQTIYDVFQYIVDLIFIHEYGASICYEYVKQYACFDLVLGSDLNLDVRRRIIKVMIFYIVIWTSSSLFDYITWSKGFGLIVSTVYSMSYVFMLIKMLTNLDITLNIMHVESRLCVLGNILQNYCKTTTNCTELLEDYIAKKDWFYHVKSGNVADNADLTSIKVFPVVNKDYVKTLSRCYLLLVEQVEFINKMFGIRVLLNSLSLLIDIIRFTNLAVLIMIGSQGTGYANEYDTVLATFGRAITCIVVLMSLIRHCELAYRKRERIIRLLDHLIINKNLDETLLASFNDLRSLVDSRSIDFHMAFFMRLEFPLLASIASVVVTYTIILLQNT